MWVFNKSCRTKFPFNRNKSSSRNTSLKNEWALSRVTLPLEQHFLRKKSHERYHASVCDRQDLGRVQLNKSRVNMNKQLPYHKGSNKKQFLGNKAIENQKCIVVNEDNDEGLQLSVQMEIKHQIQFDYMNPMVSTSKLATISASEDDLQKTKRISN